MICFAALLAALDAAADAADPLARFLRAVPETDGAAALALLLGRRPRRALTLAALRAALCDHAAIPAWLLDDSVPAAGSVAEALANLLPWPEPVGDLALAAFLAGLPGRAAEQLTTQLLLLPPQARLPAIRLATGTFRTTLPALVIARALASAGDGDPAAIQLRLTCWEPGQGLAPLLSARPSPQGPAPFAPVQAAQPPAVPVGDWLAIPAPGARLQLVRRGGQGQIWTSDGQLLTASRPDLHPLLHALPDATVIELADGPGGPQALDLLAGQGAASPYAARHAALARLCPGRLDPVALIAGADWLALDAQRGTTGLWLRPRAAGPTDPWHHWPAPLRQIDAVLVHAELAPAAPGIAALTFALRAGHALVPVARTTEGLSPEDLADLARWIRAHAIARHGPVRQVPPVRLYRLAFQSADPAPRRKAGLWLAGARIRQALPHHTADQVAALASLTGPGT